MPDDLDRIQARYERFARRATWAFGIYVVTFLLTVVAVVGLIDHNRALSRKADASSRKATAAAALVVRETRRRVNETCRISESKQKNDVDQLRRTYEYLTSLTPVQLREPLNKAVLASLRQVFADAQLDDAPGYCDAPGVGLPEPDPVIPPRPAGLPSG